MAEHTTASAASKVSFAVDGEILRIKGLKDAEVSYRADRIPEHIKVTHAVGLAHIADKIKTAGEKIEARLEAERAALAKRGK